MQKFDKYSAMLDYIANNFKGMKVSELMERWGWASKSVTYNLTRGLDNGTEPALQDLDKLIIAYSQARGITVKQKKKEKLKDPPPPVSAPEPAADIPVTSDKEPLFDTEPDDNSGLTFPSNKIKNAWAGWAEYKLTEHKHTYKSIKTEQIAINRLMKDADFDENRAIDMLELAITRRWLGWVKPESMNRFHKKDQKKQIIDNPTPEDTEWSQN